MVQHHAAAPRAQRHALVQRQAQLARQVRAGEQRDHVAVARRLQRGAQAAEGRGAAGGLRAGPGVGRWMPAGWQARCDDGTGGWQVCCIGAGTAPAGLVLRSPAARAARPRAPPPPAPGRWPLRTRGRHLTLPPPGPCRRRCRRRLPAAPAAASPAAAARRSHHQLRRRPAAARRSRWRAPPAAPRLTTGQRQERPLVEITHQAGAASAEGKRMPLQRPPAAQQSSRTVEARHAPVLRRRDGRRVLELPEGVVPAAGGKRRVVWCGCVCVGGGGAEGGWRCAMCTGQPCQTAGHGAPQVAGLEHRLAAPDVLQRLGVAPHPQRRLRRPARAGRSGSVQRAGRAARAR